MKVEELDKLLEKSFKTEPDFKLSAGFAQKTGARIGRREELKNDMQDYLFLLAVVTGLVLFVAGVYYLVDQVLLTAVFNFISENAFQVLLVVVLLNFIFFADRVLLRFFFSRWKKV